MNEDVFKRLYGSVFKTLYLGFGFCVAFAILLQNLTDDNGYFFIGLAVGGLIASIVSRQLLMKMFATGYSWHQKDGGVVLEGPNALLNLDSKAAEASIEMDNGVRVFPVGVVICEASKED